MYIYYMPYAHSCQAGNSLIRSIQHVTATRQTVSQHTCSWRCDCSWCSDGSCCSIDNWCCNCSTQDIASGTIIAPVNTSRSVIILREFGDSILLHPGNSFTPASVVNPLVRFNGNSRVIVDAGSISGSQGTFPENIAAAIHNARIAVTIVEYW